MSSDIEDDEDFAVLSEDDIDEVDDQEDLDTDVEEALPRGQRSLAVRRAIEQRNEQKLMDKDLNYLELDLEDEE